MIFCAKVKILENKLKKFRTKKFKLKGLNNRANNLAKMAKNQQNFQNRREIVQN